MRVHRIVVSVVILSILMTFGALCFAGGKGEKEDMPAEAGEMTVTPGTKINVFVDGGINVFPFELFKEQIKEESGIEIILNPVAQADVYTNLSSSTWEICGQWMILSG